jgi:hypothetical protein
MMKKALAVTLCMCLVVLAGCGTMGASPGTEPAPIKAVSAASQWDYYPDFQTLGLKMISNPPRDLSGPVEVGVTTDQDIQIIGFITDLSSGKELPDAIQPVHDGTTWRLTADFPKTGRYYFTLFGKLKSTAGNTYRALARTTFNVTIDASAGINAPENWTVTPANFKKYGVTIASSSARAVTDEADIVISTTQPISLAFSFSNRTTGMDASSMSNVVQIEPNMLAQRITIFFPDAGEYELGLYAKGQDDADYSSQLARVSFTATPSPPPKVPDNWNATTAVFKKYGVTVGSSSPRAVTDEASIVLTSRQKVSLTSTIKNRTTGKDTTTMTDVVEIEQNGLEQRIKLSFPESGEYELGLAAKGEDDTYPVQFAQVSFTATLSPLPGVPENWSVTRALFKKYVASVVSSARAVTDDAVIFIFAKQKISLAWSFSNRTTGKDLAGTGLVDLEENALQQHITLYFPESGEYELVLWTMGMGDKDSGQLARVSFTANPSPAPKVPENWSVTPQFKKYGVSVVSASPRETGEELSIVLSVPEGWTSYVYMRDKAGTSSVQTIASDIVGKEQRISAVFPASGEYTLSLSGKPAKETQSRSIATVTYVAKVDESQPPYRLWRIGGRWPRLPVARVQAVNEVWEPFGEYPSFDEYRKGVLTEAFTLAAAQGNVLFAKGATLMFARDYGNEFTVSTLAGNLAKDVSIKASGVTLVFSAGSSFVVAEKRAVGQLTKDTKIVLDGNTLLAPRGTRISLWGSTIYEILPAGKPTFTVGNKPYEISGTVVVDNPIKEGTPLSVGFKTAKDYAFKIGTTSFTLPAGSLVNFTRQAVNRAVFLKDTKVTLAGAPDTIRAGEGIQFDNKGVATKFIAEEAE